MNYLLDTCVISDFVKGEKNTLKKIKETSPHEIVVSTISVMEIHYGLNLNPARAEKIRPVIHDFLANVHVLDFSKEDAREAAMIRAVLKQQGRPIGSYDILLVGTALNRKLILVTSNTDEFERIEGIDMENWRG